jgi:hypothetical protein
MRYAASNSLLTEIKFKREASVYKVWCMWTAAVIVATNVTRTVDPEDGSLSPLRGHKILGALVPVPVTILPCPLSSLQQIHSSAPLHTSFFSYLCCHYPWHQNSLPLSFASVQLNT